MLVKDQLTGKKIDKDTAYCLEKVSSSGKITRKYYTSEEVYLNWKNQKDEREKCIQKMYDILEYQPFMKIPTIFFKKLNEEWEPYGFDVVNICIDNNIDSIKWALKNKRFNGETSKVMYIAAIIENNLNDALKEKSKIQKEIKKGMKNTAKIIEGVDLNNIGTVKQTHKVTDLLGDL